MEPSRKVNENELKRTAKCTRNPKKDSSAVREGGREGHTHIFPNYQAE